MHNNNNNVNINAAMDHGLTCPHIPAGFFFLPSWYPLQQNVSFLYS